LVDWGRRKKRPRKGLGLPGGKPASKPSKSKTGGAGRNPAQVLKKTPVKERLFAAD